MATFTFIMDYRGGTYTSQVQADSIQTAILAWARNLAVGEIAHLGPKLKQRLIGGLENDEYKIYRATPLQGLTNVWCVNVPLPISVGTIINAVKTDMQ
jgi:hypothetical protein